MRTYHEPSVVDWLRVAAIVLLTLAALLALAALAFLSTKTAGVPPVFA